MDNRLLVMKWDYEYDKEGTWFDQDKGEERFDLKEGSAYPLPHISKKNVEVRAVTQEGDTVKAELYVDYRTVTVSDDGVPVVAHASNSYSVCGDSVSQSLVLTFTIEKP